MGKKIYFGHPINTYDTELESRLLQIIAGKFPEWEIENPNQEHHQLGYKAWREEIGNGMSYFFEKVLPECQAGIFLPFRDGKWGAGIYGEAQFLEDAGFSVYEITHGGIIELVKLKRVGSLTIEETRLRIRTDDGKIITY